MDAATHQCGVQPAWSETVCQWTPLHTSVECNPLGARQCVNGRRYTPVWSATRLERDSSSMDAATHQCGVQPAWSETVCQWTPLHTSVECNPLGARQFVNGRRYTPVWSATRLERDSSSMDAATHQCGVQPAWSETVRQWTPLHTSVEYNPLGARQFVNGRRYTQVWSATRLERDSSSMDAATHKCGVQPAWSETVCQWTPLHTSVECNPLGARQFVNGRRYTPVWSATRLERDSVSMDAATHQCGVQPAWSETVRQWTPLHTSVECNPLGARQFVNGRRYTPVWSATRLERDSSSMDACTHQCGVQPAWSETVCQWTPLHTSVECNPLGARQFVNGRLYTPVWRQPAWSETVCQWTPLHTSVECNPLGARLCVNGRRYTQVWSATRLERDSSSMDAATHQCGVQPAWSETVRQWTPLHTSVEYNPLGARQFVNGRRYTPVWSATRLERDSSSMDAAIHKCGVQPAWSETVRQWTPLHTSVECNPLGVRQFVNGRRYTPVWGATRLERDSLSMDAATHKCGVQPAWSETVCQWTPLHTSVECNPLGARQFVNGRRYTQVWSATRLERDSLSMTSVECTPVWSATRLERDSLSMDAATHQCGVQPAWSETVRQWTPLHTSVECNPLRARQFVNGRRYTPVWSATRLERDSSSMDAATHQCGVQPASSETVRQWTPLHTSVECNLLRARQFVNGRRYTPVWSATRLERDSVSMDAATHQCGVQPAWSETVRQWTPLHTSVECNPLGARQLSMDAATHQCGVQPAWSETVRQWTPLHTSVECNTLGARQFVNGRRYTPVWSATRLERDSLSMDAGTHKCGVQPAWSETVRQWTPLHTSVECNPLGARQFVNGRRYTQVWSTTRLERDSSSMDAGTHQCGVQPAWSETVRQWTPLYTSVEYNPLGARQFVNGRRYTPVWSATRLERDSSSMDAATHQCGVQPAWSETVCQWTPLHTSVECNPLGARQFVNGRRYTPVWSATRLERDSLSMDAGTHKCGVQPAWSETVCQWTPLHTSVECNPLGARQFVNGRRYTPVWSATRFERDSSSMDAATHQCGVQPAWSETVRQWTPLHTSVECNPLRARQFVNGRRYTPVWSATCLERDSSSMDAATHQCGVQPAWSETVCQWTPLHTSVECNPLGARQFVNGRRYTPVWSATRLERDSSSMDAATHQCGVQHAWSETVRQWTPLHTSVECNPLGARQFVNGRRYTPVWSATRLERDSSSMDAATHQCGVQPAWSETVVNGRRYTPVWSATRLERDSSSMDAATHQCGVQHAWSETVCQWTPLHTSVECNPRHGCPASHKTHL